MKAENRVRSGRRQRAALFFVSFLTSILLVPFV
jgi:hypothetical protein